MIFALGIIGTGLLAITVLAGPSAYVLADIYMDGKKVQARSSNSLDHFIL